MDLYIHSPILLHGVVFNELSTGTTLHFLHLPIQIPSIVTPSRDNIYNIFIKGCSLMDNTPNMYARSSKLKKTRK
jgi:hypothetical protein